jgi:hypothetical protein
MSGSTAGGFWGGIGRFRLTERFGDAKQLEAGLSLAGFASPDHLAGGMFGAMLQIRLGDGNAYLPSFWVGADASVFVTGNGGNTPVAGGTIRWNVGTRIALYGALRYMATFQARGQSESFGGVTPEFGVGFVWN